MESEAHSRVTGEAYTVEEIVRVQLHVLHSEVTRDRASDVSVLTTGTENQRRYTVYTE